MLMKTINYFFIIMFTLLIIFSCTKEYDNGVKKNLQGNILNNTEKETHVVGEQFGGGIIFFVDQTGKHGLIAAGADPEEPTAWSFKDTLNGAKATAIGKGFTNTKKIFKTQGVPLTEDNDYAAADCLIFQENGYQDWYLPSKDELNELYKQKNIVGGFNIYAYWSSSEANNSKAWMQNFGNGLQTMQIKTAFYSVRPIRRF